MKYNITKFDGDTTVVTVFHQGEIYTTSNRSELFDRIIERLRNGDESAIDLLNMSNLANERFREVTDRVCVKNGKVHLDDEPINDAMSTVVVRYLSEGNDDAMPLVRFLERLSKNPSYNSREQLWDFVQKNGIHIDDEGYLILYKGVNPTDEQGVYKSSSHGVAFVNGDRQEGQIHTRYGDVVTMPREQINDNPNASCAAGLHAGAWEYARGFAPVLITVRVDPADVVSVPTDCSSQKVRVCKYLIMDVLDRRVDSIRWEYDENYV